MGFILEQTEEMGEYRAEVRKESFYLSGSTPRHIIHVYPETVLSEGQTRDLGFGTVEILTEDIPKIRAVLDAVEAYESKRR